MKTDIPHLVVVIPGIGGSELRRGDHDLWKLGLPTMFKALVTLGRSFEELAPDDPGLLDDPDYSDGIEPGGILTVASSLPGLARLPGYHHLRHGLHERYELSDLNYLEFAYDWRRDLRQAAAKLETAIDERLAVLDSYVGRAEVIIVAHSLGGLVARWWLDHHGGTERCRGLITLGTPYRGSPKAARMMSGGYVWRSVGSRRVADLLRSLPAVHQLLPIYPCVFEDDATEPTRLHELATLPAGIDRERSRQGREVLLELNSTDRPTLTSVIAGQGQTTLQTMGARSGRLDFEHRSLPVSFGNSAATSGDGTVPWIASRPLDYADVAGLTPSLHNQSHGGLSTAGDIVDAVCGKIDHLLVDNDPARAPFEAPPPIAGGSVERRLTLDIDEEYVEGEGVVVNVATEGFEPGTTIGAHLDGQRVAAVEIDDAGSASLNLGHLPPGAHTVMVEPSAGGVGVGRPVIDVVDVWPA